MIKINNSVVKEADRIYGEFTEKVAMDLSVVLPALVGSLTGGITSKKMADKRVNHGTSGLKMPGRSKLEGDYYSDMSRLLSELTVTFTPINVIFNLDGQAFEIISVKEMNDEMIAAHRRRDGEYFTALLVNKMNMELQMAERHFARQMLVAREVNKEASDNMGFVEVIEKTASYDFLENTLEKLANSDQALPLDINLDSIRPFEDNADFFEIHKVASLGQSFESLSMSDLDKKLDIGFLPDRVLFTYKGMLIEQISVMHMNEEGYDAFRRRDRNFFKQFFNEYSQEVEREALEKEASVNQEEQEIVVLDRFENPEFYKTAATLGEVRENAPWGEILTQDKESVEIFVDQDTHPMVYDLFFDSKIGGDWHELEIEAILKQVEDEHLGGEAINDAVLNKIMLIHAVQGQDSAVLVTPFTFEKFVRGLNGKPVDISIVEENVEYEEILFALDVAESICERNIFAELTEDVENYVADQLFKDNVRFVPTSMFLEDDNAFKQDFWMNVNGMLTRKWKDKDSHGLFDVESSATREVTGWMAYAIEQILERNAELLDFERPYESSRIVTSAYFENELEQFDQKLAIEKIISSAIARQVIAVMFLEIKKQEAEFIFDKLITTTGE